MYEWLSPPPNSVQCMKTTEHVMAENDKKLPIKRNNQMTDTKRAQNKDYFGFQFVQNLKERNVRGIEGSGLRLLLSFLSNIIGYTFCNQEKWKFKMKNVKDKGDSLFLYTIPYAKRFNENSCTF